MTSWAAIDYEERPKPLWYAIRRAFAPRNVVFVTEDGIVSVVVLNDTDQAWQGELELSRQSLNGVTLAKANVERQRRAEDRYADRAGHRALHT